MNNAIKWAVKQIAESLSYEYYTVNRKAERAAKHMTTLSGEHWMVRPDGDKYWVVRP